jgi:hypothetical protein
MQKVLYRSLLKIAREADSDPALKQEIIRRSHPLIQVGNNYLLFTIFYPIIVDMSAMFTCVHSHMWVCACFFDEYIYI